MIIYSIQNKQKNNEKYSFKLKNFLNFNISITFYYMAILNIIKYSVYTLNDNNKIRGFQNIRNVYFSEKKT